MEKIFPIASNIFSLLHLHSENVCYIKEANNSGLENSAVQLSRRTDYYNINPQLVRLVSESDSRLCSQHCCSLPITSLLTLCPLPRSNAAPLLAHGTLGMAEASSASWKH